MTYKTLMVHLMLRQSNTELLRVTAALASKFDAKVIGIAACQPALTVYSDGYDPGAFVALDRNEMNREIKEAESEFRAAFESRSDALEWRSSIIFETVADYVARECRSADLVITSGIAPDPQDTARTGKPGDIIMQAGRPVLVVPKIEIAFKLDRMVVAWKDTREARRAVIDSLPLLQRAKQVTVIEMAHDDARASVTARLTEICAWLKTHDIVATPKFVELSKDDDASLLNSVVTKLGGDILVAGAFGHSRLREWAFGGVTRDLTLQAGFCTLLSH